MVTKGSSARSPEPGLCQNLTANMWTAAPSSIKQRSVSTLSRLQAFSLVVRTTVVLACCFCMCHPDLTVSVEQVQSSAEAHSGVQPACYGKFRRFRGYVEQGDDQGQHRSGCTTRAAERDDGAVWSVSFSPFLFAKLTVALLVDVARPGVISH